MFLTYSQVDSEISLEYVRQFLIDKLFNKKFQYVISKESHQNKGIHFHVVLICKKKFDIRSPTVLDLVYKDQTYHGNYQPIRHLNSVIEYVCKDNKYITDLQNLKEGILLDEKEHLLERVKAIGQDRALLEYVKDYPKKAFSSSSISSLKKNFQDVEVLKNSIKGDSLDTPFTIKNFHLEGDLKEWVENEHIHSKKALILVGETGVGKTELAKALCIEHHWKAIFLNHKKDFKRINHLLDAIVCEYINIESFEDTQLLALLDNSKETTMRVLYSTIRKKKGLITILLMNHADFRKVYHLLKRPAFARRFVFHEIRQPLIINFNIPFNQINYFDQIKEDDKRLINKNIKSMEECFESNSV